MNGPAAHCASGPFVLLLHGYGQAADQAHRLRDAVPATLECSAWQGPLRVTDDTYGWFPAGLDPRRRATAVRESAENLLARVEAAGHADRELGIIGFSQGGAMAAHLMRLLPERVRFVVNLSGFVVPADLPRDDTVAVRRTPYFWARGDADTQMPPAAVTATAAWLRDHVALTEHIYPGMDHELADDELRDVRTWIEGHAP